MASPRRLVPTSVLALALALAAAMGSVARGAPMVAYDDQLRNGFQDWSWATHNLAHTVTVHSGTRSISFEPDGWAAVYLFRGGLDTTTYDGVDFWLHGGPAGGQQLTFALVSGGNPVATVNVNAPAGSWAMTHVSFDALPYSGSFEAIWLQDRTGGNQATAYLDDVSFSERPVGPVSVAVDPTADRHAIDPRIYGVNGLSSSTLPYPLVRWGGNAVTRYSWQDDVSNRASDWFFMNIEGSGNPNTLPDGSDADVFIDDVFATGAEPIITVPLIGYTPKDRVRRWGFSVAKYGQQTATECTVTGNPPWCQPDAGSGISSINGQPIVGNDPLDTSKVIGPPFVTGWMAHIASRVGNASQGGVRLFALDNEVMLWSSTHRDVHPAKLGYDEIWQRTVSYAAAMKAQDPAAKILGPVTWGWCDIFWSDLDGCGVNGPDYTAHGPFLEWYLSQVQGYVNTQGVRLVDVLDIHFYPQGTNIALSNDESAGTSAARLRSVKALYDPAYVDESWIAAPVRLVPRMRDMIAARCPGTQIALTEYNWGNDSGLSSALAQVEVLGILGRERVDMATRWVAPEAGTRVEDAFEMFLDYDGAGSQATGESVRAVSTGVDRVGAYAIRAADGKLRIYLVNKSLGAEPITVTVAGGLTGTVSLFGFDSSGPLGPRGSVLPNASGFDVTLPARSATLAVGQMSCPLPGKVTGARVARSGANLVVTWTNVSGAVDYLVVEDTAPNGPFATVTGVAASGNPGLTVPLPSGNRYYRVIARNACGQGPAD